MRIQDVMTEHVRTIPPSLPAEDAFNLMRDEEIHHLVVVDDGAVVGILSDRDTGGRRGALLRKHRIAAELMTSPVVTVAPTDTIRRAANLMRGRSIGCVVVANRGRVAGIVTVADLLTLVGRGEQRPVESSRRWTLKHRSPHRKSHGAGIV